jgi:hypothetical protein
MESARTLGLHATALRSAGLVVEQVSVSPGFTRVQISDLADTTELDLAWDARIRDLRDSEDGPILDRAELAADKMLALAARRSPLLRRR